MNRTTVVLPEDLKRRALRAAQARKISFSMLLRQALSRLIESGEPGDPMLGDCEVYRGPAPVDLSAEHDRHLYG